MSDIEILKCPVHSLTPYRHRIQADDSTYPQHVQSLVYDSITHEPDDTYYIDAIHPLYGAAKYMFAPQAGIDMPSSSKICN